MGRSKATSSSAVLAAAGGHDGPVVGRAAEAERRRRCVLPFGQAAQAAQLIIGGATHLVTHLPDDLEGIGASTILDHADYLRGRLEVHATRQRPQQAVELLQLQYDAW